MLHVMFSLVCGWLCWISGSRKECLEAFAYVEVYNAAEFDEVIRYLQQLQENCSLVYCKARTEGS